MADRDRRARAGPGCRRGCRGGRSDPPIPALSKRHVCALGLSPVSILRGGAVDPSSSLRGPVRRGTQSSLALVPRMQTEQVPALEAWHPGRNLPPHSRGRRAIHNGDAMSPVQRHRERAWAASSKPRRAQLTPHEAGLPGHRHPPQGRGVAPRGGRAAGSNQRRLPHPPRARPRTGIGFGAHHALPRAAAGRRPADLPVTS